MEAFFTKIRQIQITSSLKEKERLISKEFLGIKTNFLKEILDSKSLEFLYCLISGEIEKRRIVEEEVEKVFENRRREEAKKERERQEQEKAELLAIEEAEEIEQTIKYNTVDSLIEAIEFIDKEYHEIQEKMKYDDIDYNEGSNRLRERENRRYILIQSLHFLQISNGNPVLTWNESIMNLELRGYDSMLKGPNHDQFHLRKCPLGDPFHQTLEVAEILYHMNSNFVYSILINIDNGSEKTEIRRDESRIDRCERAVSGNNYTIDNLENALKNIFLKIAKHQIDHKFREKMLQKFKKLNKKILATPMAETQKRDKLFRKQSLIQALNDTIIHSVQIIFCNSDNNAVIIYGNKKFEYPPETRGPRRKLWLNKGEFLIQVKDHFLRH